MAVFSFSPVITRLRTILPHNFAPLPGFSRRCRPPRSGPPGRRPRGGTRTAAATSRAHFESQVDNVATSYDATQPKRWALTMYDKMREAT